MRGLQRGVYPECGGEPPTTPECGLALPHVYPPSAHGTSLGLSFLTCERVVTEVIQGCWEEGDICCSLCPPTFSKHRCLLPYLSVSSALKEFSWLMRRLVLGFHGQAGTALLCFLLETSELYWMEDGWMERGAVACSVPGWPPAGTGLIASSLVAHPTPKLFLYLLA